ncbi:centromere protein F [Perkinsela sp. CCAP 1560/4]|nr:centromere protein F [Perkinsela sp. CCAP 1560/4]|eukprot:KNH07138.1 centromere protein F [Perkinsela sp. CCAP 1560/4]
MCEKHPLVNNIEDTDTKQIIAQFQTDMDASKEKLNGEEARLAGLITANEYSRSLKRSLEQDRVTLKSAVSEIKDEANRLEEKALASERRTSKLKQEASVFQQNKENSDNQCTEYREKLEECRDSYITRTFTVIEKVAELLENYKPNKLEEEKQSMIKELTQLKYDLDSTIQKESLLAREHDDAEKSKPNPDDPHDHFDTSESRVSLKEVEELRAEVAQLNQLLVSNRNQYASEKEVAVSERNQRRKDLNSLRSEGETLEKLHEDLYYKVCSIKSSISTSYCKLCNALLLH